eukprot:2422212-Rhodomonas_salina.1
MSESDRLLSEIRNCHVRDGHILSDEDAEATCQKQTFRRQSTQVCYLVKDAQTCVPVQMAPVESTRSQNRSKPKGSRNERSDRNQGGENTIRVLWANRRAVGGC